MRLDNLRGFLQRRSRQGDTVQATFVAVPIRAASGCTRGPDALEHDHVTKPTTVGSARCARRSWTPRRRDDHSFAQKLDGDTITLTSGELDISKNLQIVGPGASELTVSGGGTQRRIRDYRGRPECDNLRSDDRQRAAPPAGRESRTEMGR